jgi:DNA-binding NarL/FixJ family response regulator
MRPLGLLAAALPRPFLDTMFWINSSKTWQGASVIRILIVEDHPDVRDALVQAFAPIADLHVMGVAKDQPEALQLMEEAGRPDVFLVDLCLPQGGDGTTVIRRAARLWGKACTSAVLTAHRNEANLMHAVHAGAVGYLDKSTDPDTWVDCVRELAQGKSPLNAPLAKYFRQAFNDLGFAKSAQPHPSWLVFLQQVANGYRFSELCPLLGIDQHQAGRFARQLYECLHQPPIGLTPREMDLLRHLGQKYALTECATLMGITAETVKTHSQNLYAKLGTSDKTAAVMEARRLGLIT